MPLGDPFAVEVARLRVAYYIDDGTFPVAPAVRRAVVEAAGMLAGRGAQVTEWRPPDPQRALHLWLSIIAADGGKHYKRILRGSKIDPRLGSNLLLIRRSRPTLAVIRGLLCADGAARARRPGVHLRPQGYLPLLRADRGADGVPTPVRRMPGARRGRPIRRDPLPRRACPRHPPRRQPLRRHRGRLRRALQCAGLSSGGRARHAGAPRRGRAAQAHARPDAAAPRARPRSAAQGLPLGVQVVAPPWREHVALAAMLAIEEAARIQPDYPAAPAVVGACGVCPLCGSLALHAARLSDW